MNKGLLDFLQSASNAVASNVSGPIDLIGMGLNKIGVPVGSAPVGGTEWMKQKGLMRDVEQGPARVMGETAGLLGPALASKFAPQIARGLLQGGENLAAPRRLNKEAGAIKVYRGGNEFGMTADAGGPTFFSTQPKGAEPFARHGAVREVDIDPKSILDGSRGEGMKLYDEFLNETKHPAGRGQTFRPFWTSEHELSKWLKAKGKQFDAVMFDEPNGIPSYAVYSKDVIK